MPKKKTKPTEVKRKVNMDNLDDEQVFYEIASIALGSDWDKIRTAEFAMLVQQVVIELAAAFHKIDRICEGKEARALNFNIPCGLDRGQYPPEVLVGVSFSDRYGHKVRVAVPDPDQMKLWGKKNEG